MSRKYAYQVLLSEELSRCGVELIFLKSPAGATPEDQRVVQFQGMIAEYECAQIAERRRRGKRPGRNAEACMCFLERPLGIGRGRRVTPSPAFYEVIEAEAQGVRMGFEIYTRQGPHQRPS